MSHIRIPILVPRQPLGVVTNKARSRRTSLVLPLSRLEVRAGVSVCISPSHNNGTVGASHLVRTVRLNRAVVLHQFALRATMGRQQAVLANQAQHTGARDADEA